MGTVWKPDHNGRRRVGIDEGEAKKSCAHKKFRTGHPKWTSFFLSLREMVFAPMWLGYALLGAGAVLSVLGAILITGSIQSKPLPTPFDQEAWVRKHWPEDPATLDRTKLMHRAFFEHPHHGCAFALENAPTVRQILALPLAEAALYADAVTVKCPGHADLTEIREGLANRSNWTATSAGCFAYIALHHPDAAARNLVVTALWPSAPPHPPP